MKTKEEFEKEAQLVHRNKYNYNQYEYTGAHKKSKIICNEHGEFYLSPNEHITKKVKCRDCANIDRADFQKKGKESYLEEFENKFPNMFEFPDLKLEKRTDTINIKCKKCGHEFKLGAKYFLRKGKCPECPKKVIKL